uniref:Uncharacterized protein n=1 Tax=Fagus sylvatica TaxID=28930 RepID=A0A2N9EZ30_FAGSY
MAQKLEQQLKEVGSKLETPPSTKDALVKLLKDEQMFDNGNLLAFLRLFGNKDTGIPVGNWGFQ